MRNLDPGLYTVAFKGIDVQGYMDGTFISAERNEAAFNTHVGADGNVTRVRNRNKTGKVTITLVQTSNSNELLSAVADSDEANGDGVGALMIKDLLGLTVYKADEAWIEKLPKGDHGKDAMGREWVFACAELKMIVGGSLS